ncbi:MAG: fibronectin type III domain-containing protein, partial [Gammaproteobacteria bacterium]
MNAALGFRRLRGIAAGLLILAAGVAPAHAVTRADPPTVEVAPLINSFITLWLEPGYPAASRPQIRWRYRQLIDGVPQRWNNPGGADGKANNNDNELPLWVVRHDFGVGAPGGYIQTNSLPLGTIWEAQVAVVDNGIIGRWSHPQRVTIGTPVRPHSPVVTRANGFKLAWAHNAAEEYITIIALVTLVPNELHPTTGYRVRWRRDGETAYAPANSANLSQDARSHVQSGLVIGAKYYVQVAGTTSQGPGPWTAELPITAGGPPYVKAWAGKVGGIDVSLTIDPGATKEAVQWRKPGLRSPAQWTSIEVENATGHYQLSHENNGIEPGGRYEVQVRGFVNNAWQDWSLSGIARSSTQDDLAPRLRWMAVSEANGDLRMTEPAVSSEVFAYSVYIPSAITLANFAVQPKTRATKIVVTAPDDSDFADVTVVREKAVVPLTAGEGKTVTLELTSRLGGLSTYTLTIKRDRLRALELVAAEVNAETLSPTDIVPGGKLALRPAFAPDVRSYDLSVSHHVPKLRLRLAADSTAVSSIVYFNELDADSKFA